VRAIVVGGGLVGSTLASKLASDGHDVVVVEQNRKLLADFSEKLDVSTLAGNGATVPVLVEAGIRDCDLLLATTDSDEANMVVALVGSALFRVPKVVARLRDSGHERSFRSIAHEVSGERLAINPDMAAVQRLRSLIGVPGAADVVRFFKGRLLVAGFQIRKESDFAGLLLSHLRLLFPKTPLLVLAIRRERQWIIPHGDDEILAGDLVYFAMDPDEMETVLQLLGVGRARDRRVMIAGATRIGLALAKLLEQDDLPVTVIDERADACEEAAAQLDASLVVQGYPTDRELLEEESVDRVQAFAACTNDHEVNVVSCLLARRMQAGRTFALVDNPALVGLIGEVGIDSVISPRMLSVEAALQFVRRGRVTAVAALLEDTVEVIEVEAEAGSRLVGSSLAKIDLPRGVLVAAVERNGRILVPSGDDVIEVDDHVLLITTSDQTGRLDAFLETE
jgi:trk system potassium uptake protein TrkA